MAVEAAREQLGTNETIRLKEGMSTQEAVDAFSRILCCDLPQVIISTKDLHPALVARSQAAESVAQAPESMDRAVSPPAYPRPALKTDYVAPRNEIEQTLADIWQSMLGIAQVGIHDNFFELGGDSVISIQIIAKAHQTGLKITPKQAFEHQTVAELAAAARPAEMIEAEPEVISGRLPLTPIQRWFFEQHFSDPHHFNQAMLLEVREPLEFSILQRVVERLVAHHDMLRVRYGGDPPDQPGHL